LRVSVSENDLNNLKSEMSMRSRKSVKKYNN